MESPSVNAYRPGMWYGLNGASKEQLWEINQEPVNITKNQIVELYLLLYPLIVGDFSHRSDIESWAKDMLLEMRDEVKKLNSQLDMLREALNLHTHVVSPVPPLNNLMAAPTLNPTPVPPAVPSVEVWKALPEDSGYKYGESLITKESDFSINLEHRDPSKSGKGMDSKVSIPEKFKNSVRATPFDPSDLQKTFKTKDVFAGSK